MRQFCPGLIHGFLGLPNLWEISEVVLREMAVDLRRVFYRITRGNNHRADPFIRKQF